MPVSSRRQRTTTEEQTSAIVLASAKSTNGPVVVHGRQYRRKLNYVHRRKVLTGIVALQLINTAMLAGIFYIFSRGGLVVMAPNCAACQDCKCPKYLDLILWGIVAERCRWEAVGHVRHRQAIVARQAFLGTITLRFIKLYMHIAYYILVF